MKKQYWVLILLSVGFIQPSFAQEEHYYNNHAKGWHWYDDPIQIDSDEESETKDPITQMSVVRDTIQRALDNAVLHPTQDNIRSYISLQNEYMNHAGQFANNWKATLVDNPNLDYSLVHPTNNAARQVEQDEEHQKEVIAIHLLAKESGLFFFYHSTCPYCQRFAPIVKQFAEQYGISVIPVTTDGISLPEFPNSYLDQGQAKKFNVTVEPALFAVNPSTQKAYPIGYGLMSEADLKKRILDIATHFQRDKP